MTPIQTNDGRVHIADCAHVTASPAGLLSEAVATEWAKACDFISVNPAKVQNHGPLMASLTKLGLYVKTAQDSDGSMPNSYYSYQLVNGKLVKRFIKQWSVYITQPDSAWAGKHLSDLAALIKKYPWCEFFFMDSAGTYSFTAAGTPVNPTTHKPYTVAQWLTMLKHNIDTWNTALPFTDHVLNGLQDQTVDLYTPQIGQVEAAFGSLHSKLPTEAEWGRLFDQVWHAQQVGWTPWLYVKMSAGYDTTVWNAFRDLCLPSAYLMDRSSLLYCQLGIEGAPPMWQTGEYKHPWYNPDIGMPLPIADDWRSLRDSSGAYVKHYEHGVVIVNPTTAGVSVTLDDASDPIAMDAQSGTILRERVVWEPIV